MNSVMNRLHKLLTLSHGERIALFEAWLLLVLAEVRLRLPLRRKILPIPPTSAPPIVHHSWIRRLSELVRLAASHHMLSSTCLKEALVLSWLLRRRGIGSQLRIGVAREAGGAISAHSWLEVAGRVVIGDPHHHRYVPLQPVTKPSDAFP